MDPTKVETLARWAGGTLISGDPVATASVICTDSRSLKAGDLFLALRGERFDGHAFLDEAGKRGAVGAVIEEISGELPSDFVVIKVDDTLRALQAIAGEYRRGLDLQVVAITGRTARPARRILRRPYWPSAFRSPGRKAISTIISDCRSVCLMRGAAIVSVCSKSG